MATFQNQASLTFNDNTVNSNIVTGEIIEVLSLEKTSLNSSYSIGDTVTYILSVVNSGSTPFTGVRVSDNLASYGFGTQELYPLTYVDDSAALFINGTAQNVNVTYTEDSLIFSGFTLPANSSAIITYRATVNGFAPPTPGSELENTATLTATGLTNPVTATATVPSLAAPLLSITKGVSPDSVPENGQLTYTLTAINTGSEAATDNLTVSDTFNPILSNITVTYNGTPWTEGVNYTYDETTGVFTTLSGQIIVPAATYNQDPITGLWTTNPGSAVIRITGTV